MGVQRSSDAGLVLAIVLAASALAACGDDDTSGGQMQPDAGKQNNIDAGHDAGHPPVQDAGHDAGHSRRAARPGHAARRRVLHRPVRGPRLEEVRRPTAMPYTPGVVLWSDGAEKQRYLYLPPGTKIDTSDMDVGSFRSAPRRGRSFASTASWSRRACSGSATHKTVGSRHVHLGRGRDGGPAQHVAPSRRSSASGYEIPTLKDCGRCHHGGADKLLGIEAVALALPDAQGVTLAKLVATDSLSNPPAHDVDHAARRRHRQSRLRRSATCTRTAACRVIRGAASATRPSS